MHPQHILVTGATGGIGHACVQEALRKWPEARVYAIARSSEKLEKLTHMANSERLKTFVANLTLKPEAEEMANWLNTQTEHIDLAIHTIGVLNGQGQKPEKSLGAIDPDSLREAFETNVMSAIWTGTVLKPLFRNVAPSVFMILSAKVGSIGDNKLGGWYSYRMAKAALNMGVRNMALEYGRSGCPCAVVAVHPGTTLTPFSEDYVKGWPAEKLAKPEVTAARLLTLAETLSPENTGTFMHWDGSPLPW
ncbi:MAG: SDR family NAD(P)-dependent oxidoreductase [Chitinophagaceae bacterium]|nr:SDR family NAD(P)-dependent oxidoreductase [Oligoflexus sp.]